MTSERPQTAAQGSFNLFVGNLVSTAILAVATIVAARLLTPNGFGLYTIALIVPSYIVLIISLGLSTAATRFAAKYFAEGLEQNAVSIVFSLSILEFVLSVAAILMAIPFSSVIATDLLHRPELSRSIIIVSAVSASGLALYNTLVSGFYGLGRYHWSALLQVIQSVAKSVVAITLILVGFGVLGAVTGYTVGMTVSGAIGFFMILSLRKGDAFRKNFGPDLKVSLAYSAPVYIGSIFSGAIVPVTNTVLAFFVSNSDLGGYSSANNLSVIITVFLFPITTIFLPIFSKGVDTKKLAETYRMVVKFSTLFIVPVTAFVIAFSYQISAAVYGSAYQFAGLYLALMSITDLLTAAGVYSWSAALAGIGETKLYLYSLVPGALATLLSVSILVRFMGVSGAIISGILGQVVSLIIAHRFLKSKLEGEKDLDFGSVWRICLSSGLAVCVPLIPVLLLRVGMEHPLLTVAVSAPLFLVVLVPIMAWTRTLTNQDIETLESSFKSIRFVGPAFHLLVRYYRVASQHDVASSK